MSIFLPLYAHMVEFASCPAPNFLSYGITTQTFLIAPVMVVSFSRNQSAIEIHVKKWSRVMLRSFIEIILLTLVAFSTKYFV